MTPSVRRTWETATAFGTDLVFCVSARLPQGAILLELEQEYKEAALPAIVNFGAGGDCTMLRKVCRDIGRVRRQEL